MNWKPGDRAIVVGSPMFGREIVGEIVHITSRPYLEDNVAGKVVDIEPIGKFYRAETKYLKPIDDYDGHQVTTWDGCVWKPSVPVLQRQ